MSPPFASTGKATPDEDDGAFEERLQIENDLIDELGQVLDKQLRAAKPKRDEVGAGEAIARVLALTPILQGVVFGGLSTAALLGANRANGYLDGLGLAVDFANTDEAVKDWIGRYSFELVGSISNTTQRLMQKKITAWTDSGAPLGDLVKEFEPVFGKTRAQLIASTEVTRAFARGNVEAWLSSPIANQPPEQEPPAHPRCRCWVTMAKIRGVWSYRWNTAFDERVCPICAPLHRKAVGVAYVGELQNA